MYETNPNFAGTLADMRKRRSRNVLRRKQRIASPAGSSEPRMGILRIGSGPLAKLPAQRPLGEAVAAASNFARQRPKTQHQARCVPIFCRYS